MEDDSNIVNNFIEFLIDIEFDIVYSVDDAIDIMSKNVYDYVIFSGECKNDYCDGHTLLVFIKNRIIYKPKVVLYTDNFFEASILKNYYKHLIWMPFYNGEIFNLNLKPNMEK